MTNDSDRTGLSRRPNAARSLVRGVAVKGREVHITTEHAGIASVVAGVGGFFTMVIGGSSETTAPFTHQGPGEIGLEIVGAVAAPWLIYGGYKVARATVRSVRGAGSTLVEAGRADIEKARHNRSVIE